MPKFAVRRRANNPKTGFNCEPAKASKSGMARFDRPGPVLRGTGKTIGKDEKGVSWAGDIQYPGPHVNMKIRKKG